MRGTSYQETLWANEDYERLEYTHRYRLCAYRADKISFAETQFK